MPTPTFVRASGSDPLFFLQLAAQPPGLTDYCVAFLPSAPVAETTLTLTLDATWTVTPGIYCFLATDVDDQAVFAAALTAYVGSANVRFLWIVNPNDPSGMWSTNRLVLTQTPGGAQGTLQLPAEIGLRNYALFLAGGTTLAITGDAFTLTPPTGGLSFSTDTAMIPGGSSATLPFAGDAVGCLQCALSLSPGAGFAELDACCRYFIDARWPTPDFLTSLRYPVLATPAAGLALSATLDPVNALLAERTYMNLPVTPPTAIASGFVDVYGSAVTLTPVSSTVRAAGPALVFAVAPTTTDSSHPSDPLYLTFVGSFALTLPVSSLTNGASVARFLCGFAGVEYVGFSAASNNLLHFFAGQPAYAPAFRDDTTREDAPPLTSLATSAWAALTAGGGTNATYFAQPQASVIYEAADVLLQADAPEGLLAYLEVPAGTFPPAITETSAFPLVPYAMVGEDDLADVRRLEERVLSPARRQRLATVLAPTESGPQTGSRQGATPQGLLLGFDQQLNYWETLTLLRNRGGTELLQVQNITGGFKSALQSNQLFAVVTNADEFLACCTLPGAFSLDIDGWTFDLAPASWRAHHTILLMKYGAGTIEELAQDSGTWAWQAAASGWGSDDGTIATVQTELLAFIAEAKQQTTGELRQFYDRVLTDPAWTGILFLRANLSTSSFPPDLQGLAAGIAAQALYAHHVGATATPIHSTGGVLSQSDSSIFGLIDYRDPSDLAFDNVDYAYKVLSLSVTFANSAMSTFSSQIELMINRLFADFASLENSVRSNNLILNGYYQQQAAQASYVFIEEGVHRFALQRSVLRGVEVTRAQFVTVATDIDDTVHTMFILGGNLQFEDFPGFDAYSFGPPSGTIPDTGGLRFSNLLIHMDFAANDPATRAFRFDATAMAFDLAGSLTRPGSLFEHFPLKFAGLAVGAEDATPGSLGFIAARSPQSAVTFPWFALAFQLQLGTLGALAASAGLTATIYAAWQPAKGARKTYIGLKLPGSSSSRPEIPIEGVLKLAFDGIDFTWSNARGSEYLLRLRNMKLRLLGLTFPPGQNSISLFGDPSGGRSGALGWYAAYLNDPDDEKSLARPDPLALRRRMIPRETEG